MSAPEPPSRGIPLGDVEVADRIARAVRGRKGADRTPTLEQLMEAFGAGEPGPDARSRVAAALDLAGVTSVPEILSAPAGGRLSLDVVAGAGTGAAPGEDGAGASARRRILVGLLALVALGGAAAGAATLSGEDDRRLSELPAAAAKGPKGTSGPSGTSGAAGAAEPAAEPRPRVKAKRASSTSRARERTRARDRARVRSRDRAAARRRVRVTLTARQPTYLCVDSGPGTRQRFEGTLRDTRVFRGRRVRVNVGLGASTTLRVNGDRVALRGSPAGYDLTPRSRRPLGLGRRPSCR